MAATNCAALPTANAGQYATLPYNLFIFFLCSHDMVYAINDDEPYQVILGASLRLATALIIRIGTGTIARTTTARPTIARCILLAQTTARADYCSEGNCSRVN